ncbi:MAG: DNA polymerase/3'-5' exonuclease PolX [Campylobacterota bacterium]|nr:DNA polymerase/3'-5' exonuclease PolX [Campylobacterota bacterium]
MTVSNQQIASIFIEIADLLDIEDANPFRIRAYRNAARNILSSPKSMETLVDEGFDLTSLRSIGKDLSQKIIEIVRTGELAFLNDLKRTVSIELETLLRIPGLGPSRVRLLHERLHINSLHDLKDALQKGKIEALRGFGPKLIDSIAKGVEKKLYEEKRYRLFEVIPMAEAIIEALRGSQGLIEIEIAGSIRRRRDTVHDIDIVASCEAGNNIMARFTALEGVDKISMQGTTRSSVILKSGIHIDLRVVPKNAFGAALHHFTGSKPHNIALRKMAVKNGLKINEYGVFKGDRRVAGERETDIYDTLGLAYVEPEMRENRGEIDLAREHNLPKLIEAEQIKGDLHIHTNYTDGAASIKEMALAAKAKGYEYIAVTDHTKHLTIAHGLDEKRVRQQLEEIDRINEGLEGITILKSAEVDILANGTLDLPNTVLKELDLAVCAVHYKLNLSKKEQTKRILKAMENPYFTIFAHPTGRLLGLRDAYELDMKAIIDACAQNGCILELNAQPDRLDIDDIHAKMAKEAGVKIAISTDAHSIADLDLMHFGIGQARRGWLEKEDVVNTKSLKALLASLKHSSS